MPIIVVSTFIVKSQTRNDLQQPRSCSNPLRRLKSTKSLCQSNQQQGRKLEEELERFQEEHVRQLEDEAIPDHI
jgi:hypothetical protein